MQPNESLLDRVVRAVLGAAFLYLAWKFLAGYWAFLGYLVGVILLVTAMTGYCHLYKIFGISTKKQGE